MALHSTVREIIASSESLAAELGINFSSRNVPESGLLLTYARRGSSKERGFRFDLLFPFRGPQTPSKTSLRVYRNGTKVDIGIDTSPQRITVFSDVEYILRRMTEERTQTTRVRPDVPDGAFTLSYDELSASLGAWSHDIEADYSGMTLSLYGSNEDDGTSVKLHFYEEIQKQGYGIGGSARLALIGGEVTTGGSRWADKSSELPIAVVKSVYDLVNMVDNTLSALNRKKRNI